MSVVAARVLIRSATEVAVVVVVAVVLVVLVVVLVLSRVLVERGWGAVARSPSKGSSAVLRRRRATLSRARLGKMVVVERGPKHMGHEDWWARCWGGREGGGEGEEGREGGGDGEEGREGRETGKGGKWERWYADRLHDYPFNE